MMEDASLSITPCSEPGSPVALFSLQGVQSGRIVITLEALLLPPPAESDELGEGNVSSETAPLAARWDVSLLDERGGVVDMYPGLEADVWWGFRFSLHPLPLYWDGAAAAGALIPLTVSFIAVGEGATLTGAAPEMICIRSSTNYQEGAFSNAGFTVSAPTDGETIQELLNIQPEGWSWITRTQEVRRHHFCVETNIANITEAAPGTRFAFSVLVEMPTDPNNWPVDIIWRVDMCSYQCNSAGSGSAGNTSQGEKITFPLLGFKQDEVHPGYVEEETDLVQRPNCLPLVLCAAAVAVAFVT